MKTVDGDVFEEASIFMLVHGWVEPTADDFQAALEKWSAFARAVRARGEQPRCFVWTRRGAGPNAKQRRDIDQANRPVMPRIGVVNGSAMTRGIVTAIAWFNSAEIRAFSLAEAREALAYVETRGPVADRALASVERLEGTLKGVAR
jgi:hypothetical protein